MTTTLEWTVYDGTPETLPRPFDSLDKPLLLLQLAWGYQTSGTWMGYAWRLDRTSTLAEPNIGDMWSPWPEVPKVDIHA